MVPIANILAVAVMVLAPFVQPCWCGDFTLFCECPTNISAIAPECDCTCCETESTNEDSPERVPSCPDKHAPGKQLSSVDLPNTAQSVAKGQAEYHVQSHQAAAPLAATSSAQSLAIPPPPTGLMVVQTQVLQL
jgi:hypothetical protein